jgi:hypothetical protein
VKLSISTLIVAAAVLVAAISAASGGRLSARLSLQSVPGGFAVAGRGFGARERVVVRASVGSTAFRRVLVASPAGRFSTTLPEADSSSCAPVVVSVSATGRRGSTAFVRHVQIPDACGIVVQP